MSGPHTGRAQYQWLTPLTAEVVFDLRPYIDKDVIEYLKDSKAVNGTNDQVSNESVILEEVTHEPPSFLRTPAG